ncbi:MAG: single-stranded DNA-binding protein [Chlamydiae bacterium]|jgi:single-strand DNA-binding protein|nr:single-stranded DNA-binding protein [Chlamydiota bacterium]
MNNGMVAGHLGSDPETRFTSSGQKVTTFRVGCKSRKDESIWWRVTIWGDQFDKMLPYFKKGSPIIVQGEITKPEIYTDKEGKPQVSMQIVATNVAFSPFGKGKEGEGKFSGNSGEEGRKGHSNHQEEEALSDEEIPF